MKRRMMTMTTMRKTRMMRKNWKIVIASWISPPYKLH
jgi:hypothetical protein